ncbi:MAG: hypothetical protein IPI24_13620 [Ignavibacteria bacterium]|nr:hypothetical protein [Ignavibacteria bacterium]
MAEISEGSRSLRTFQTGHFLECVQDVIWVIIEQPIIDRLQRDVRGDSPTTNPESSGSRCIVIERSIKQRLLIDHHYPVMIT